MKKLSRGQRSAVGVVVGIASRAELTIFDEPYAGLDAVARHIFYDRLLQDYARFIRAPSSCPPTSSTRSPICSTTCS